MRIIFWGKGERGNQCLKVLCENGTVPGMVVAHPGPSPFVSLAIELGIEVHAPEDPNGSAFETTIRDFRPDLMILGGYGKILRENILGIPRLLTVNLHGGRLPAYRGSSPLNWALLNGEREFTLSVIRVDAGVDTGEILLEKTFPIGPDDTIRDLHAIANREFPGMLLRIVKAIGEGNFESRTQTEEGASYYPLRFPEDGLIVWDLLNAVQVHNRIRALTDPYPGAFAFYQHRKVMLLASQLNDLPFYGTPGRIYRKSPEQGLLVCASDRSLWIRKAVFADSGEDAVSTLVRYDRFMSLVDLFQSSHR